MTFKNKPSKLQPVPEQQNINRTFLGETEMENLYIAFQCPTCHRTMEIENIETLKCPNGHTCRPAKATPQITNERGKTQLEKDGVKMYLLVDLFSEEFLEALETLRLDLKTS